MLGLRMRSCASTCDLAQTLIRIIKVSTPDRGLPKHRYHILEPRQFRNGLASLPLAVWRER